jgi:hypothetical protein
MMNYLGWFKKTSQMFFHYQSMLVNVALALGEWMTRHGYSYIPFGIKSPSLPPRMIRSVTCRVIALATSWRPRHVFMLFSHLASARPADSYWTNDLLVHALYGGIACRIIK